MKHKLTAFLLIVWMLLMMPITALAQDFESDRVGSISVTLMDPKDETPITGAELSLFYVATVTLDRNNDLSYTFTDAFEDCGSTLEDPALSVKLDAFVKANTVAAEKRVTDTHGNVTFTNLPLGLYFVQQTNTVAGYAPCTAFLVTVPIHNADRYVYDVNASPKTDVAKLTDITIRKVWNTDASAKAADRVTVQLLKDGLVIDTAVLSAQNNWQITYTDMPESDMYSVVEVNVPMGFTATYSQRGYVFTVTNTASLAQTGQLIWPIPVLAMAGLCLIAIGTVVLITTRNKHA